MKPKSNRRASAPFPEYISVTVDADDQLNAEKTIEKAMRFEEDPRFVGTYKLIRVRKYRNAIALIGED